MSPYPMPALHDEAIRKAFGSRVKELRKRKAWMQKQLADKIGVTPPQLNKYEAGVNAPAMEKLVQLADALDTTVDYLLTGDPADTKPLHNLRLLERFKALQDFESNDREVVITLIDAMIAKRQIEEVLRPPDSRHGRRSR